MCCFTCRNFIEKNVQLLMETVDELGQDTQKFHNYQRNSARQQQQKDAYLLKRVGVKIIDKGGTLASM